MGVGGHGVAWFLPLEFRLHLFSPTLLSVFARPPLLFRCRA